MYLCSALIVAILLQCVNSQYNNSTVEDTNDLKTSVDTLYESHNNMVDRFNLLQNETDDQKIEISSLGDEVRSLQDEVRSLSQRITVPENRSPSIKYQVTAIKSEIPKADVIQ